MTFSRSALQRMTIEQLNKVCTFFGLPVDGQEDKEELIETIMGFQPDDGVPRSVRVWRIYNSSKENK
jgi:hypothetical protein